jgi:predicted O-methyltransferase YrrM
MRKAILIFWKLWKGVQWIIESKNDRWLHPPWLFELYQKAFRNNHKEESWCFYEKQRRILINSEEVLDFIDPGTGFPCKRTVSFQAKRTLLSAGVSEFLAVVAKHLNCNSVLEMGTSLGITTLYLAGDGRRVITIEGAAPVARIAERTFERFPELQIQLMHSRFEFVLADALRELQEASSTGPVMVWIDGHHAEGPTEKYIDQVYSALGARAVVVLDDIRWSAGMFRAWKRQCKMGHWPVQIDVHRIGILIADTHLSPGNFKLRPPLKKIGAYL